MARLVKASDPGAIELATAIIRQGGLVAFPTETVYGLGADACNADAVVRIFEAKRRPYFDPLIVHIADREAAHAYGEMPPEAERLAAYWPGPLTLVVPKKAVIPPIVTAGLDTVALRVPDHAVALELLKMSGTAIAAPSANPFGYVSPTTAEHVMEQLAADVDVVLDGGPCSIGVESTIIALDGPSPRVLRVGGLPLEEISRIFGVLERSSDSESRPEAPGQLTSHYATITPLQILTPAAIQNLKPAAGESVGLLSLKTMPRLDRFSRIEILSPRGDLREAAAGLFAALRRLDRAGLDRIVACPVPETGLGAAIMDRLYRCSARRVP